MKHRVLLPLLVIAALAGCNDAPSGLHGYVEGEYVYIAPTTSGLLATLSVRRGDRVAKGQPLFALDQTTLTAAVIAAQADAAQAAATLADLSKGKRPDEIAVIAHQKDQAQTKLDNARREFERAKVLLADHTMSQAEYDQHKADRDGFQQNVDELSEDLAVAGLPARSDQIAAAQAALDSAKQKLIQAQRQKDESIAAAPTTAMVEDTYFNPGEFIPAGKPVVSLLPPENVKVRFFVSQASLPSFPLGRRVTISCDGCGKTFIAAVSYISTQAEYTPPVIYSTESRQKLVFLIEATPDHPDPMLRPGLPIDIALAP